MNEKNSVKISSVLGRFSIIIVAVVLFVLLSILSPHFLGVTNIMNLWLQSIFVMITAFGMMFVLTIAGIDLSVGAVMGFCGAMCGMAIANGAPTVVGIILGVVLGFAIGIVNGLFITKLNMAPFLVTFAMSSIIRGCVELMTTNGAVSGFAGDSIVNLSQGYVGVVPIGVIITMAIFVVIVIIIKLTKVGRILQAIGYNKKATGLSGIPVKRYTLVVYGVSGLLAAFSGIMLAARLSSVPSTMGNGYEMDAIAACVIGGVSMSGGKAKIVGVLFGTIVLQMISNGLDLLSINQFYRQVIEGIIIIFAVAVEGMSERRQRTAA